MTKEEAISRLVTWANNQVGYPEGDNNWNKYAEGIAANYGWNIQNQPWCDIFVDRGFIECFGADAASRMTYQPNGSFSALCSASAAYYRQHHAFYPTPEPGDQVFFYVGSGINHTGIVVNVGMGAITTVEGNSSDTVARRTYAIDSQAIAGYGRPDWSVVADISQAAQPEQTPQKAPESSYCGYTYNVAVSLLKKGNYGPQVLHMQQLLNANGFECDEDGQFGDQTYKALMAFQRAAKIGVDGEWGGESFRAMWNYKEEKS